MMPQGLLDSIDKDSGEEPEGIFTEEEERTFEELKQRHKSSSAESGSDGEQSSKVKTSQITKESVKIVDGVKTTSKQMIINGKLVSSEVNEEYVGSKAAVDDVGSKAAVDEAQDKTEND